MVNVETVPVEMGEESAGGEGVSVCRILEPGAWTGGVFGRVGTRGESKSASPNLVPPVLARGAGACLCKQSTEE